MNYLAALAFFALGAGGDNFTVEYTTTSEGPRVVYEGVVRHNINSSTPALDCLYYEFDVPKENRLAGPAISSNPGQALLSFDRVDRYEDVVSIGWCNFTPIFQTLPCSVPRYFIFYSVRTTFGTQDLEKLLGDWGLQGSHWDLNLDGYVGGEDLAILLAGWGSA